MKRLMKLILLPKYKGSRKGDLPQNPVYHTLFTHMLDTRAVCRPNSASRNVMNPTKMKGIIDFCCDYLVYCLIS